MGCSDNWARDNIDREEAQQHRDKERSKLQQRRSNDTPSKESPEINDVNPHIKYDNDVRRAFRYAAQFDKLVGLLTDEELERVLLNDLEFRSVFTEQQAINKAAGRSWIECKFSEVTLLYTVYQVEIIRHSVSKSK